MHFIAISINHRTADVALKSKLLLEMMPYD